MILSSSVGSLNADQLSNWTSVYSMFALNGIPPADHLECWHFFVVACGIFCSRAISVEDGRTADTYIMKFCEKYALLYGNNKCTLNMHMHGHIWEYIVDYGPVYRFWCFPFERFNGIMEQSSTNNHCIELTMMRRFIEGQGVQDLQFAEIDTTFRNILQSKTPKRGTGETSLCVSATNQLLTTIKLAMPLMNMCSAFKGLCYESVQLIPPVHEQVLSAIDKESLCAMFQSIYNERLYHLSDFTVTSRQVNYAGELLWLSACS